MKKLLALILAAALALSLVACGGGSGAGDNNTPSGGNGDATSNGTPTETNEYAIGDMLSTDCIEVSIISYDVVTAETVKNHPKKVNAGHDVYLFYKDYLEGSPVNVYSDSDLETIRFSADDIADKAEIVIIYSAKNIGKEVIESTKVSTSFGFELEPYGNIVLNYDDGYKFDAVGAFQHTLDVLDDGYIGTCRIMVPMDVINNTDKPLNAIVSLPNSASNTDDRTEFIVNLR